MHGAGKAIGAAAVSFAVLLTARASSPRTFHDPRTTAKKLSQGLEVDGAGRFAFDYKALHYNQEMFDRAAKAKPFMDFLNSTVWGRLGKARLDFELVGEEVKLAPGEYEFGLNLSAAEEFSVVFWKGSEKLALPLSTEREQKEVPYLTVALMATEDVDTFVLEARCGPYRGTVDLKVPFLDEEHEHATEEGDGRSGR
jgi:hypothetical protein